MIYVTKKHWVLFMEIFLAFYLRSFIERYFSRFRWLIAWYVLSGFEEFNLVSMVWISTAEARLLRTKFISTCKHREKTSGVLISYLEYIFYQIYKHYSSSYRLIESKRCGRSVYNKLNFKEQLITFRDRNNKILILILIYLLFRLLRT